MVRKCSQHTHTLRVARGGGLGRSHNSVGFQGQNILQVGLQRNFPTSLHHLAGQEEGTPWANRELGFGESEFPEGELLQAG